MEDSRDTMLSFLQQHKQLIRQRTVDPSALNAAPPASRVDLRVSPEADGKPWASRRPPSANPNVLHAGENLQAFLEHHYRVFHLFAEDSSRLELELTADLSAQDRKALHSLAEACNLAHHSNENPTTHQRSLTIQKDVLFFKNRNGFRGVDLAALARRIGSKDSKFDLRRVRAGDPGRREVGAIGGYDDETALTKIMRFKHFTDEYRHAVEMGYSQEDALAMRAGDGEGARLEELLRRPAPAADEAELLPPTAGRPLLVGSPNHLEKEGPPDLTASRWASEGANSPSARECPIPSTTHAGASEKRFVEHCRGCGSQGEVDYPIEGWSCQKYCSCCARHTIWCLTEQADCPRRGEFTSPKRRRPDDLERGEVLSDDGFKVKKQPRVVKESIERESDESEEEENHVEEIDLEEEDPITVEDVVDMACTNDFAAADTNWLRHFASVNASHLAECVFFCIKYEDMLDIYARFERTIQKEAKKRHRDNLSIARGGSNSCADVGVPSDAVGCVYVVIREDLLKNLKTTDLIQKMCAASFSFPPNPTPSSVGNMPSNPKDSAEAILQHIGLAFLNASVYGSTTTAVCQLRPCVPSVWSNIISPFLYLNKEVMLSMQQDHGKACFYLASSLEDAVRFVVKEE
ncbi:unnamed protein product [Phytomonas sp. Hart1]|nr:unnamed protein product [Phytomonas sp. Hart1]|eukprot:CCW68584.1 unnamed protein product [Phytomonas sp. isolate Hart1]